MPSDLKRLASGSALRVISRVLSGLVAVLLTPFVIRTLGDRLYGFWTLVGVFMRYYGFMDLGLGALFNGTLRVRWVPRNTTNVTRSSTPR